MKSKPNNDAARQDYLGIVPTVIFQINHDIEEALEAGRGRSLRIVYEDAQGVTRIFRPKTAAPWLGYDLKDNPSWPKFED